MSMISTLTRFFVAKATARRLTQLDSHLLGDVGLTRTDVYSSRFMGLARRNEFFNARRDHRACLELC